MKLNVVIILIVLIIVLSSCFTKTLTQPSEFDQSTAIGLYKWGQYYLQIKNYEKAVESFYDIVDDFDEDTLADDAQFMIAQVLSNPKSSDYDLGDALSEYENLIDNYPLSPFVKIAEKKIAEIEKKLEQEE